MRNLRPAICVAEEVGAGLGIGEILQRSVPEIGWKFAWIKGPLNYFGEGLRAHDKGEAERLLARGLKGLGLTLAQAAALKKTDARKQALAWLVKSRTMVGDEGIVARLAMGHRSKGSRAVSAYREPPAAERRKLLRILHTCTD